MFLKMKVLFVLLIFVTIVVAETADNNRDDSETDLARKKKSKFPFHFLGYGFGIHALGILYWIKVKAIIISFILGTAAVWGFKYFSQHFKSCPEVIHEGPIIPYDHGWHGHDHISYSSPHEAYDPDPYGGYHYSDHSPDVTDSTSHPYRRRASKGRKISTEEQVSDIIFTFLGVGSDTCRKRFLCEMEFRANDNPLTQMAFRIIGRGVFFKYVRNPDETPLARNFAECGEVHKDCKFIEENIREDETNEIDESEESSTTLLTVSQVPDLIDSTAGASPSQSKSGKSIDTVAETILRRPSQ